MTQVIILRRRGLGAATCRGVAQYLEDASIKTSIINTATDRNPRWTLASKVQDAPEYLLLRWGCTASINTSLERTLNNSEAIHQANDKKSMRLLLQSNYPDIVPRTMADDTAIPVNYPLVLRPRTHAQGKNLWLVRSPEELEETLITHSDVLADGWYAGEFIDKVAEFRVYLAQGRVFSVAQKTPEDPSAIAWNVARGGRFDVVNFNSWPMAGIKVAAEAFGNTSLDISGVDIMLDRDGRAYVIELNSAPSLPFLSDGSISYRQKCLGKVLRWMVERGQDDMPIESFRHWRDVIHPAILEYPENRE